MNYSSPDMYTDAANGIIQLKFHCSRCKSKSVTSILVRRRVDPEGYLGECLCDDCILPDDQIFRVKDNEE